MGVVDLFGKESCNVPFRRDGSRMDTFPELPFGKSHVECAEIITSAAVDRHIYIYVFYVYIYT